MICKQCGSPGLDHHRFCATCGCPFPARCPACGAETPDGSKFCPACGQTLSPRAVDRSLQNAAGGERKQVTIFFADFAGFTAFSAERDPEDVSDYMQAVWKKVDAIIQAHGGTPEKHSGDGIMAVFGGRKAREEDPAEAVRAALEVQAWLQAEKSNGTGPALQMRIGIHTGLAVVGPANPAGEFLATGDTVNLASRLEQSAPAGGVLISGETYRHVFGFFDTQGMPPLMVKGKTEPVETCLVLRAKPRGLALQMRGVAGIETELIGRRPELEQLQSVFELTMRQRQPHALTVFGDGGIGKSRLFHEFQKRTELLPQYFRLFTGRATTEITGVPFALIRDLFSVRFEILESDPASVASHKFQRGLEDLLAQRPETAAWSRAELLTHISFIGQLLGFDFSAAPGFNDPLADAQQLRQRAFRSFNWLLAAMTACPVVAGTPPASAILLVMKDLHWADHESLDLIDYLAGNCQDVPLMILYSARPVFLESRAGWGDWPGGNRVNLQPLSPAESNALVESILRKVPEIPPPLRELITDGAEGNPFYIEEMVKMLMDQKVIVSQADQWQINLDTLANARIPSTLTGVLQARLDSLSAAERIVLQRASVIGRVFWDSAVAHLGSHDAAAAGGWFFGGNVSQPELLRALEGLQQKELVFRRETSAFAGAAEFMFKHELLRNVAYESLLKKLRRQYHAQIAAWLKDQSGDRSNEFAGLIATHFEHAAQFAEAADWHGRAGQRAHLTYAPSIAAEHFKKALQLASKERGADAAPPAHQLEWQAGLGEALAAQAHFSEALDAYTAMRDCARQQRDLLAEARAWNGLAYMHERCGDNRASIQSCEQAESLALRANPAGIAERIRALHLKGWAYYRLGDAAAVLALGSETQKLCAAKDDQRGIAVGYKLLGVANLQLGRYPAADGFFEQGRRIFEELNDPRNAAAMWSNRGETARACGDYQTAAAYYEQALAIVRQIGNRESELIYLANLSGARLELGQFEPAETDLRQVIRESPGPNSCMLSEACAFLSLACLGQGKFSEAGAAAQRVVDLARESESALYLGVACRACGQSAAGRQKHSGQTAGAGDGKTGRVRPSQLLCGEPANFPAHRGAGGAGPHVARVGTIRIGKRRSGNGPQEIGGSL